MHAHMCMYIWKSDCVYLRGGENIPSLSLTSTYVYYFLNQDTRRRASQIEWEKDWDKDKDILKIDRIALNKFRQYKDGEDKHNK